MKIKALLFLTIFSLIWVGCSNVQSKESGVNYCRGCRTERHEGCEYVIYTNASYISITHKGNCDNPIHK
jgi:predicted Fe-S protein YdhL (DUF1289 family)